MPIAHNPNDSILKSFMKSSFGYFTQYSVLTDFLKYSTSVVGIFFSLTALILSSVGDNEGSDSSGNDELNQCYGETGKDLFNASIGFTLVSFSLASLTSISNFIDNIYLRSDTQLDANSNHSFRQKIVVAALESLLAITGSGLGELLAIISLSLLNSIDNQEEDHRECDALKYLTTVGFFSARLLDSACNGILARENKRLREQTNKDVHQDIDAAAADGARRSDRILYRY